MNDFRLKIIEVITEISGYKYFRNSPDITKEAIAETAEKLAGLGENEISEPKRLRKKARKILEKVFYEKKHKSISPDILGKVNEYYNRFCYDEISGISSEGMSDWEKDQIREKAYNKFVKYFNPAENKWSAFATQVLISVRNDIHNNPEHLSRYLSDFDEPDDDDIPVRTPEQLVTSDRDRYYIDMWDTMRDMIIAGSVSSKKDRHGLFSCFLTDNISAFIEVNDIIFHHIEKNEKKYLKATDIEFLNFFVDYDCKNITDSRYKPRKPMSAFDSGKDDEQCKQPLGQKIYALFKNVSISTVSNAYNEYRKGLVPLISDHI